MRQSLISDENLQILNRVTFLVGNEELLTDAVNDRPMIPFDGRIIDFLAELSKNIREDREAKQYPDVITFGFWIRKASMTALSNRFVEEDESLHVGRGITFHVAPSNVPVNYAYSLVTGLVTGNICVVRVPSKDFPQVEIINRAIKATVENAVYHDFARRIFLVRYERNNEINNVFSQIADVRIIWGGDNTIEEIRRSPIGPRSTEITFADRYSLAVIDSDMYLNLDDKGKDRFSEDFYNDTFLTDQNACTSPRVVVWLGNKKEEAKEQFWSKLDCLVHKKYTFQPIMGVNKLTNAYLLSAKDASEKKYNPKVVIEDDNYIVRVVVDAIDSELMDYKDNSGYFFEYDCDDIMELVSVCDNTHCQTIGYLGGRDTIMPLAMSGVRGIDRIVPIGKTMDFDLIWDGYDLYERLTRTISINI